jgi:hypothetical protein
MANTSILIKRSTTTGIPGSLAAGELAYSYQSNTIFIGSPSGTGVVNVGGQYYTSQIDTATDAATANKLVRRDASGNASFNYITANVIGSISGNITGNANSATQLQTARDFSISGGDISASAVSFDGTQNVTLNASLNSIAGLNAGVYGGTNAIPVVKVAANGRIMEIANASLTTSLTLAGDTGTDTFNTGDTLFFVGGDGITTTVSDNTVSYAVDTTVFRSNTAITKQTVDGDVEISGNLIVLGTETVINVETLNIADPLLYLASNNYISDIVDIGFVGNYSDGTVKHAGVFRHAGTKEFFVFDGYTGGHANNVLDVGDSSFKVATLNANLKSQFANVTTLNVSTINASSANISSLTLGSALSVPNGGTGATSFTNGSIIIGSGTGALATLANSSYTETGSGASNNTVSSISVDAYGRVTAATFSAISGLTVAQGGTGASTLSEGGLLIGNGTGAISTLANTTYVQTGTATTSNTITSISVDAYGRLTAATTEKIALDTSQITSGTLGVARGGTGASTLSEGGLLIGNGTGAISTLANTTYTLTGTLGAAKTITSLTVDAYGRLTAATAEDISGLTVTQGGTGASTFTANGIVYGSGTGALQVTAAAGTADQAWSNQILTTTNAGVPVWTTALDGGQF